MNIARLNSVPLMLAAISVIFWLADYHFHPGYPYLMNRFGQLFGIIGYSFFAFALLTNTRIVLFEKLIGGLDRVYHLHHQLGTWGFICFAAHPILLGFKWLPNNLTKAFTFIFPIHRRTAVNLGSWAFWALVIILGLTYLKLLPYDKWKITHKFLSAVFIVAALHVFFVHKPVNPYLLFYLALMTMIGLYAIIYRIFLFPFFHKSWLFKVEKVERRGSRVVEVSLSSETDSLRYQPGQFVFISFISKNLTKEQHPFTICTPAYPLSVSVKALGDFTSNLVENLRPGDSALVEGPYGVFSYKSAGRTQVWIAGGIGITPFLCWARELMSLKANPYTIDLYYCVPLADESAFLDEFQKLAKKHPSFCIRNICTRTEGHVTAEQILGDVEDLYDRDIYMCGPKRMTKDLRKQFLSLGVQNRRIHFEDFEFI